jgi:hypothetical protein
VQEKFAGADPRANQFPFVLYVDEKIIDRAGAAAKLGIAGTRQAHFLKQAKTAIHLETEIGHVFGLDRFEFIDPSSRDKVWQLSSGVCLPARDDSLGKERREFALEFVFDLEVDSMLASAPQVVEDRHRFSRVMIAVVTKEYDLTANL